MKKKGNEIKNISIIGLLPEYNNQVASLLAEQFEMYFLDVKKYFEFNLSPLTIDEIVKVNGAHWYRKEESYTVKHVSSFNNTIMTFGCNVFAKNTDMDIISKKSLVVYLKQSDNNIKEYQKSRKFSSVEEKNLFFLNDSSIKQCRNSAELYSDIVLDVSNVSVFKCMSEVIRSIKEYYGIEV